MRASAPEVELGFGSVYNYMADRLHVWKLDIYIQKNYILVSCKFLRTEENVLVSINFMCIVYV